MQFIINSDKDTAFSYLAWQVKSQAWYQENGYPTDNLEDGKLLEDMKKLLKNNPSKDEFREHFYDRVNEEWYDEKFFKDMHCLIQSKIPEIEKICLKFSIMNKNWGFKLFDTYKIDLTYGGPGGSYNYQSGTVIIRLTKRGREQESLDLKWERIIPHEMVHIGIEENIVKAFGLTQNEKERVVDIMTRYLTGDPYMQARGDKSMDTFVTEKTIIDNLPLAIKKRELVKTKLNDFQR